jgi:hypothetical protein
VKDKQYEYAIEMDLQGLAVAPDLVWAHKELRLVSLQRKALGGKSRPIVERLKAQLFACGTIERMLAFERLLCYDPGNADFMVKIGEAAHAAGAASVVAWIAELLNTARS